MIFKVGTHEYEFSSANQTITKDICNFHITLADTDIDIEQMDSDIRPIVKDGFELGEEEYIGYELQVISKNYVGEAPIITVQLVKNRTEVTNE